jgi:hypothetical protein
VFRLQGSERRRGTYSLADLDEFYTWGDSVVSDSTLTITLVGCVIRKNGHGS